MEASKCDNKRCQRVCKHFNYREPHSENLDFRHFFEPHPSATWEASERSWLYELEHLPAIIDSSKKSNIFLLPARISPAKQVG